MRRELRCENKFIDSFYWLRTPPSVDDFFYALISYFLYRQSQDVTQSKFGFKYSADYKESVSSY